MKVTSTKGLTPLITIIVVIIVVGIGIITYQFLKIRNLTLDIETTTTTILSQATTITTPTSSTVFCLNWDFFKDPKNYNDRQSHEEIKVIQEKLGVTPVGGHYGPLTKAALNKFNEDYNIIIPAFGCCGNIGTPAHLAKGLTELTLIKFNDLYCSLPKPKVTITLINYPTQSSLGGEYDFTYIKPNGYYDSNEIKIEPSGTEITVKTIEIPYSGSIKIIPSFSSSKSIYDDDTLVWQEDNHGPVYNAISSIMEDKYKTLSMIFNNPYNITYDVMDVGFTWHGIEKDRDIKFEFGKE